MDNTSGDERSFEEDISFAIGAVLKGGGSYRMSLEFEPASIVSSSLLTGDGANSTLVGAVYSTGTIFTGR